MTDLMQPLQDSLASTSKSTVSKPNQRVCGGCTLCCKLLPVRGLGKPASTKCAHARYGKGCAIYARPPDECRLWSCQWLVDPNPRGLPRPDRCHYVVDIVPDTILAQDHANGTEHMVGVIQVWVDPAFPEAWRDPALLDFLAVRAEIERVAALIRFGSLQSIVVFAPAMTSDGRWHERASTYRPGVGLIERLADRARALEASTP